MDKDLTREPFTEVPDRFYFNEMKREIAEIGRNDVFADYQMAETDGLIPLLGEAIVRGTGLEPAAYSKFISSNQVVMSELWRYTTDFFHDAQARRGYAPNDFRGMAVSLCSASIRTARLIDTVKKQYIGQDNSTQFTNALNSRISTGAAIGLVAHNPETIRPGSAEFAAKLAEEAFRKIAMERNNVSWSWSKTHLAAEALATYTSTYDLLRQMPELRPADVEVLQRQITELADASTSLRTYTPKPAIGKLQGFGLDTLFIDKEVHQHFIITDVPYAKITPVRLFPEGTLPSSNVTITRSRAYKNEGGAAQKIAIEGINGPIPHSILEIYDNRDLVVMGTFLNDFAKTTGMEGQAALLTALLLSQNFDLTVPVYVVDLANEAAETMEPDQSADPQADKLRRLLLARTRVLQEFGSDIEREIQNESDDSERPQRDIAKHEVAGFLRPLPRGYKASQVARELCMEELGREIPEGQTYVKKHTRGSLEVPSKGHIMAANPKAIGRIGLNA